MDRIEFFREMNAATRMCRTGDNSLAFRTAGVRMDRCDLDTFSAACADLQPIDAPEFLPSGMTSNNATDQLITRPGFVANQRILEMCHE